MKNSTQLTAGADISLPQMTADADIKTKLGLFLPPVPTKMFGK